MEIQGSQLFLSVFQVFTSVSAVDYIVGHVKREWKYSDMEQAHLLTLQPGSNTNEGTQ